MAESVEPIVAARRHPTPDTEQSETKKSLRVYILSLSGITFGGRNSRMVPTGTAVSSEEAGELAEPRGFFLMRCTTSPRNTGPSILRACAVTMVDIAIFSFTSRKLLYRCGEAALK